MVLHWYVNRDTMQRRFRDYPNRQACIEVAVDMQLKGLNAWCDFWHWEQMQ
jgi:hypothetical protein